MLYLPVFLSGCAGLIYEMLWIQRAALAFGSSTFALATVLAVVFLGLGLGSEIFGRWASALRRPLVWLAGLELLLAILGSLNAPGFAGAEVSYERVARLSGAESLPVLRGLLVALLLLPPTLLMGGTLPLLCRAMLGDPARVSTAIGRIYGINTLGALLGCAATGFVLLPELGIEASTRCAVGLNFAACLGFLWLDRRFERLEPSPAAAVPHSVLPPGLRAGVGILLFLAGAMALANELLWARFLAPLVRNSVYTYTLSLGVVLAGTVLGSLAASRWHDRAAGGRALLLRYAVLQAGAAALNLGVTHLPVLAWMHLRRWGVLPFVVLMLPSAVVAGACFPLAQRIAIGRMDRAPMSVGRMTALNIVGGVFGSLATGFLVLPGSGLDAGIYLSTGTGIAAAFLALMMGLRCGGSLVPRERAGWAMVAGCAALWLALPKLAPVKVPEDFIARRGSLADFAEGYVSTLAAIHRDCETLLLMDQLWQGSSRKNHQIMAAHLPMLHYPGAKRALLIGLGVGQTARRFLDHGVERLDIVDIEPKVFGFVRRNFASDWMADPRARLIAEDGRSFVRRAARRYDLISVEVGQLFRPGVEAFYTQAFYREARAGLNPGGVAAQFVPLDFLRPAQFASVLGTFLSVFPEASLWYNTSELLLMGWNGPVPRLAPGAFERALYRGGVRADMDYAYWGGSRYSLAQFPVFLGGFLATGAQLRALAQGALIYTDDRPRLAYAASDFRESDLRTLDLASILGQGLSPLEAAILPGSVDAESLRLANEVRRLNLGDLSAAALLDRIDPAALRIAPEAVLAQAEEALRWNPNNLEALRLAADALVRLGRDAEAVRYREKATESAGG